MENTPTPQKQKKCYNTFSCIASVLIIIFITGAILSDLIVTKPKIFKSIDNVRTEVQMINQKIDDHYNMETTATEIMLMADSLNNEIISDVPMLEEGK